MYTCFTRRWWKLNPGWPDGREPDATARKTWRAEVDTEEEAQAFCREWNETHKPGKLSVKCEYTAGGI